MRNDQCLLPDWDNSRGHGSERKCAAGHANELSAPCQSWQKVAQGDRVPRSGQLSWRQVARWARTACKQSRCQ